MYIINIEELFNQLLTSAELLFGKCIGDWTYNGIEYNDRKPCLLYYHESGQVTISLSQKALDDELQLIFQLSHEICHLLYPSLEYPTLILNKTLVINEGISTYFSVIKTNEHFNNKNQIVEGLKFHSRNYYDAYLLVNDLLTFDKNVIINLRHYTPRIDKLKENDFDKIKLNIPLELKRNLVAEFR